MFAVAQQLPMVSLRSSSACCCLLISGGESFICRHGEVRPFYTSTVSAIHTRRTNDLLMIISALNILSTRVILCDSTGWSTECLQEWGSYMKLAIPSVFMVCFEWWIWEIGGFLAGKKSYFWLCGSPMLDGVPAPLFCQTT